MKLSALLCTLAWAQDERAMSLDRKIENAQSKCAVYMGKAMTCEPPSEKIGKYTFRLDKVLLDAKHHLNTGKCDPDMGDGYGGPAYRKRRETVDDLNAEFDALMQEMAENDDDAFTGKQYGSPASQNQLKKLEGLCQKFIDQVFNDDSLADCKKLGAWTRRANGLMKDLVAMKNVCLKQAEDAMNNDGMGGYPSKPAKPEKPEKPVKPEEPYTEKPKPTKPPKTEAPEPVYEKPTKKPKPSKKPKKPKY